MACDVPFRVSPSLMKRTKSEGFEAHWCSGRNWLPNPDVIHDARVEMYCIEDVLAFTKTPRIVHALGPELPNGRNWSSSMSQWDRCSPLVPTATLEERRGEDRVARVRCG